MSADPREALSRLTRWREQGDGPVDYTAGNQAFAADVAALLDLVQKQQEALKPFADAFAHQTDRPSLAPHRRAWNAGMPGHWPVEVTVTMADGRRARDLLAPTGERP